MASWILVPCLVKLRSEFNAIAPNRDKSSDGSVGDDAHQDSQSDHNPDETGNVPIRDADRINEVHAIDVDDDLHVPGLDMEDVVQFLLERCRSGAENRLRYIIFKRRIWSASDDWRPRAYTGSNAHDQHAHFSASYSTGREADTRSWNLEDEFMAVDYEKIRTIVREEVDKRVDQLIASTTPAPTAADNAEAVWQRVRNDPKSLLSDTAVNLTEARITEALVAGVAIERYPYNEGK